MYDKIYVLKKASKSLSLQLEAQGPPQSSDRRVMYRCDEETCHGVRTLLTKAVLVEGAYNVPWVVDGDAPRCLLCRAAFTTFRRRHHCRACGKLVCHECLASRRIKVVSLQRDEHASIVCVSCYDSLRVAPQPPPPKKEIAAEVKAPQQQQQQPQQQQQLKPQQQQQQQQQQQRVASTPATSHTVTSPSIVWDASSDGVSTPGSTSHTSPTPPAPCFWEDAAQDTPEATVSEKYFYTPVSLPSTPAAVRPVTTSRALAAASATGVWKGDGGSDDASNLLQPLPGFSIKCSRVEGEKVYINVCHHSGLAEYNRQGELGREVSILVGPSHQAIDESGALFSGWDVVCASSHVTRAFEDGEGEVLRALCEAVLDKVSRTHSVSFAKDFKLARTGAGYIGGKPSKMSVL